MGTTSINITAGSTGSNIDVSTENERGLIQTVLANNNDIRISYGKRDDLGVVQCMLRDCICMKYDDDTFYVSEDGWRPGNGGNDWTKVEKSDVGAGTFYWALFIYDETNDLMRLCMHIGSKVYHNYSDDATFSSWAESDFWGLPNTLHPTDATTKSLNGKTRPVYYNPNELAGWAYFLNGCVYNQIQIGSSIQRDALFIAPYQTYNEPATVFLTLDGKDWYAEYQFGIIDQDVALALGQNIDVSGLVGGAPADLEMVQRSNVTPDVGGKDPANIFTFGAGVSVNSITDVGGKARVTTGVGHGLSAGDVIHFTSAIAGQNTNNWLAPTGYADIINNDAVQAWVGDTPPGGNGKFYKIEEDDATHFYIHEAIGSPHNNHYCRHIHGLNQIKGGVLISTGESAAYSNIIFLQTYGTLYSKPLADFDCTHVTADVDDAPQRPMGFYMNTTHYVWASDWPTGYYQFNFSDRGAGNSYARYKFTSNGVYRGLLANLDAYQSADPVLMTDEACYMFQVIGNVMYYCGAYGSLYASTDEGETWKFIYSFGDGTKTSPAGFNSDKTEFVADNILFEILT